MVDALPEEVLDLVFVRLNPKDFLSFCSTSKSFYQQFHLHPFYWRNEASSTFRLPVSPLLHADGARWYWLYKKLKTQTRLYLWGQGVNEHLGTLPKLTCALGSPFPRFPTLPLRGSLPRTRGRRVARPPAAAWPRISASWPTEILLTHNITGAVVDVQCGGWSTSLLTSDGKLFSVGTIDQAEGRGVGGRFDLFKRLEYLTQSTTAIRQFSTGRRHVLALDDTGSIISWDRIDEKGYEIYPRSGRNFGGRVKYVCAGWSYSSAYVPNKGIVYWQPVVNDRDDVMLDGIHVKEYTLPDTAIQKRLVGDREHEFQVLRHIVLEGWIVFLKGSLTSGESELFACRIGNESPDETSPSNPVFLVPGYDGNSRQLKDLQGSFRSFAVFTGAGKVLAGNIDYLNVCAGSIRMETSINDDGNAVGAQAQVRISDDLLAARPTDVPILQHRGVISIAFGDYHFLALHADGSITAHGTDSSGIGSLGLGKPSSYGWLRGLRREEQSNDYELHPTAARRGRQVWFEPAKKDWLEWLDDSYKDSLPQVSSDESHPASGLWDSPNAQAAFSEWVEQQGRHWADGPEHNAGSFDKGQSDKIQGYEILSAYFAISVTAGGWRSGALVMVDEEKADSIREKWIIQSSKPSMPGHFEDRTDDTEGKPYWDDRPFPSIRLPDGRSVGSGPLCDWRDGIPTADELGPNDEAMT